jgi:nitronate monooxygenase
MGIMTSPMAPEEFGALLNVLLEAERAGARLLRDYLEELPPASEAWRRLHAVQRDEARNCLVLLQLLRAAGVEPSQATGDFYRKALAVEGWPQRLQFLNLGQAWVARRIGVALPRIPGLAGRKALQAMHRSHLVNIGICEQLQRSTP